MDKWGWPYVEARRQFEIYRGELMSDNQNSKKYLLDDLEDRDRQIKTSGTRTVPISLPSKHPNSQPSLQGQQTIIGEQNHSTSGSYDLQSNSETQQQRLQHHSTQQQCRPSFPERASMSILEEKIKTRLEGVIEKIDAGSTDEEKVRIAKDTVIELVQSNQAYELNDQHKNDVIFWYKGNPEL